MNNRRQVSQKMYCVTALAILFVLIYSYLLSYEVYRPTGGNKVKTAFETQILASNSAILSATSIYTNDDTNVVNNGNGNKYSREAYYLQFKDGLPIGVLSNRDWLYFEKLRRDIDNADNVARCIRYHGYYNRTNPRKRKIFYGALTSSEPWELYEITSTEGYGLYSGVVLVEGNRTQNFTPRKFMRLNHTNTFRLLFGTNNVQIRSFVNEDHKLLNLHREHEQRSEILKGWKELGMTGDDVGLLALVSLAVPGPLSKSITLSEN